MGRNGGGSGDTGGSGSGGGGGGGRRGSAAVAPGNWNPNWGHTPHTQPEGWGQPQRGWPQHSQATNWTNQAQAWGRPNAAWAQQGHYGKGYPGSGRAPPLAGPYPGSEQRGRRGANGLWQGIQDATAAARLKIN